MTEDSELLRSFVDSGSEADLRELVQRNAALVYHAALRRVGGRSDLAEEVSQYVFTTLVQQAPKLVRHSSLAGWLFTTTRNCAYRLLREEERRRKREAKFAAMTELSQSQAQAEWEKLRPHLDELLDQLPSSDREAVLLRHVQGHSLSAVGAAIGLNSDGARKRVDRAVGRLRALLIKRGLLTSTAVVAELLATEASAAAPTQLATRLAAVALKNALSATGSTAVGVSLSSAAAVGIMLAAITVGGGAIGFSIRDAHAAEANLASAEQSCRRSEARLVALQTQLSNSLASSATSTSVVATPLPKTGASATSPSSPAPGTPEALANGAQFLSTVPEARSGLSSFCRTQQHATFATFYRAAKLTPLEIETFEQRVAEYRLASVEFTHDRLVTTAGDFPPDQVQALLGPERATLYKEYLTSMPVRILALEAAAASSYSTEPVSPALVDEMTRILADTNGALKSGGKLDPTTQDWPSALPALEALFTPIQWSAVEGYFAQQQYNQLLQKLQTETAPGTSSMKEAAPKS